MIIIKKNVIANNLKVDNKINRYSDFKILVLKIEILNQLNPIPR